MTQSNEQAIWMSPQAFDVLKAELDDLAGPKRTEVVEKIAAARDEGDLKENGGYHAAKEEQGKLEARIRQLDELLRVADTAISADDDAVTPGKLVVTDPSYSDTSEDAFLLAARVVENAYPDKYSVYSPESPFGSAVLGAKKGDTVIFTAPNGKDIKISIKDVTPYS
ncbi:MAG TPA: transcription elongation factor GreA [Nocardioidaceae bacterium]|nr:transcription elongation factor GreA [Nocardioidaceae bacterium]